MHVYRILATFFSSCEFSYLMKFAILMRNISIYHFRRTQHKMLVKLFEEVFWAHFLSDEQDLC